MGIKRRQRDVRFKKTGRKRAFIIPDLLDIIDVEIDVGLVCYTAIKPNPAADGREIIRTEPKGNRRSS